MAQGTVNDLTQARIDSLIPEVLVVTTDFKSASRQALLRQAEFDGKIIDLKDKEASLAIREQAAESRENRLKSREAAVTTAQKNLSVMQAAFRECLDRLQKEHEGMANAMLHEFNQFLRKQDQNAKGDDGKSSDIPERIGED
ncbi:hypothetical protein B0T16DRAFT_460836 [Cercophora newfieldiana]|uniref:Uncharacterized protein n=1 Tax=Cercophora newfieldiana TaxID=92897 RepID=A0AA40CKD0_9PEZI|nr:hypothetical protein B0T16DRAFT_460836 [Cercophora newfieldiana]